MTPLPEAENGSSTARPTTSSIQTGMPLFWVLTIVLGSGWVTPASVVPSMTVWFMVTLLPPPVRVAVTSYEPLAKTSGQANGYVMVSPGRTVSSPRLMVLL